MSSTTLILTPFTPVHFDTLAAWFPTERDVILWGGPALFFPLDQGQLQAMLDQGSGEQPARLCWMVERAGVLVGHAQLGLDWRHGNATLSRVAVAPEARGQNLAIPMLRMILNKAFALPGMERVELNVFTFNAPAIRTYERLGFIAEGVRRSSVRVGNERWDTLVMGLLQTERGVADTN